MFIILLFFILLNEASKVVILGFRETNRNLLNIAYSLSLFDDGKFVMQALNRQVPAWMIAHITMSSQLDSMSQVANILAFLKNYAEGFVHKEEHSLKTLIQQFENDVRINKTINYLG